MQSGSGLGFWFWVGAVAVAVAVAVAGVVVCVRLNAANGSFSRTSLNLSGQSALLGTKDL